MTLQKRLCILGVHIERRLRLRHGFTSDRNALFEAINAATGPEKPGSDSATSPTEKELNLSRPDWCG